MNKKLRLVVVGADWYGGWAKDFYLALQELGLDAEIIYTNNVPMVGGATTSAVKVEKIKKIIKRFGGVVFNFVKWLRARVAERKLLSALNKFDGEKEEVVVICVWTPLSPSVLRSLKEKGIRLVLWQGEPAIRNEGWSLAFPLFDHIFIVDDEWVGDFKDEEVRKKIKLLPLATNPHIHHPIPPDAGTPEKYKSEIAFVGLYRRERAQILSVLKDLGLKIYGPGWEAGFDEFPWLKNSYFGMLSDEEVMTVFNNAKISIGALGISFNPGPTTTQRTFDISCSKKFQLSQHNHLTPKLFGEAIVTFKSTEELRRLAEYYLAHPEERERLAIQSYEIASRDHTYLARAKTLLTECGFTI